MIINTRPLQQLVAQYPAKYEDGGMALGALPEWCGDRHLHKRKANYYEVGCCINHVIGLPRHPATGAEMPLTPFQEDFIEKVAAAKAGKKERAKPHKFHINKGRQMGFTEIVLRKLLYGTLTTYAGRKVGIIAGTNGDLARKDLKRMARLYRRIPWMLDKTVQGRRLQLTNGTVIEAFPASEEAMTGDTDYAAIFLDEAAKWRLIDDEPVFNSIMPIVNTNGSDLFLVSTPKGPAKMFYTIHKDPGDFVKFKYDIWHAKGNMYSKKQIDHMLATAKENPEQEYLGKFVVGADSALLAVTDDMRDAGREWLADKPPGKGRAGDTEWAT